MSLNLTSTVVFTMDLAGCEILLALVTNPQLWYYHYPCSQSELTFALLNGC